MLKRIGWAGLIAGVISGGFLFLMMLAFRGVPLQDNQFGALLGYASMLVALSFIFVAIKRQRDVAQGGVIRFLPAFGMGLAISVIAGVIYALAWEVTLADELHDTVWRIRINKVLPDRIRYIRIRM